MWTTIMSLLSNLILMLWPVKTVLLATLTNAESFGMLCSVMNVLLFNSWCVRREWDCFLIDVCLQAVRHWGLTLASVRISCFDATTPSLQWSFEWCDIGKAFWSLRTTQRASCLCLLLHSMQRISSDGLEINLNLKLHHDFQTLKVRIGMTTYFLQCKYLHS